MFIVMFAILALPALLGIIWSLVAGFPREKVTLLAVGTVAGIAAFATLLYATTLLISLQIISIALVLFLLAGATAVLVALTGRSDSLWQRWRTLDFDLTALIVGLLLCALFSLIAPKLLIVKPDGLYTGIINAYGDIAWHMANITAFAEGQTHPPENPIFAGTPLTYPFMTNFLSAALLVAGASYTQSVNSLSLLLIPILLTLFYCLVRDLTGRRLVAVIALLLFVFGGSSLGWVRFPAEWQASGLSLGEFLTHLPNRDYSGVGTDEQGFHFLNATSSLLLPQRSFLFAFPLAFSILLLLRPGQRLAQGRFLLAGGIAGILPLFHAHTIVALLPALAAFFFIELFQKNDRRSLIVQHWIIFALTALVVGLPEIFYYLRGIQEGESFLRWGPGWMAGERNILWYWFLNTGLLIPTAALGLWLARSTRKKSIQASETPVAPQSPNIVNASGLAIAGLILFIIANLYLFAPWAWDNFKVLIYFLIFILPLVSLVAVEIFRKARSWWLQAAVVILLAAHLFSGALDIWKLTLPTGAQWSEWDTAGIVFANAVKQATKPGEIILTAPNHNSPIVLSGRPRYLGYAAHVWSHGGNPWQREGAIKEFYEGNREDLPETTPVYFVVGPHERLSYPNLVIQPAWQPVVSSGDYNLYRFP